MVCRTVPPTLHRYPAGMKTPIPFHLNGVPTTVDVDDDRMLLWVLRTELGLTGTRYGCGEGFCGACNVSLDGKVVRSCRTPVRNVAGREVLTIEGLAPEGRLTALQQAFIDHGAFQCGFCTSGMLLLATELLQQTPAPSRAAILAHMERNLCRCGAHQRIVLAIEAAAAQPAPAA